MKLILNNISHTDAEDVLEFLGKGQDKLKKHLQNNGKKPSTKREIQDRLKNKVKKGKNNKDD